MPQRPDAPEIVDLPPPPIDVLGHDSATTSITRKSESSAERSDRTLMPGAGAHEVSGDQAAPIIRREFRWFDAHGDNVVRSARPRMLASRWIGTASCPREHEAELDADYHVLGIALRPIQDLTVFAAGKLIHAGQLRRGSMRVNEPGVRMRGIFRGAYDVLHLHIPNALIAEYLSGQTRNCPLIIDHPIVDPVIERLGCALIHAEELGGAFGQSYADGIGLAIAAHLCGGNSRGPTSTGHRVSSLSKWRLKRATDFMGDHLAESIGLVDIAAAAGLSRMHFAAQFRMATGLRPHEYLQRRRIERARELLLTSRLPLVEVAFEVGFKTQAHFTSIFARLVGETPNAWRQRNYRSSEIGTLIAA
jgi:AraC family transcriptional regulator